MSATDLHLTTGWEPDAPIGDSLARTYLFNHVAYDEAIATAAGGRIWRTTQWAATDLERPATIFNAAILLQPLDENRFEKTLGEIEDFFRHGSGTVLLWSLWPTPDLRPRGWYLEGHPPLLIRPPGGPIPEVSQSRPLWSVRDPAEVLDWERIVVEGYAFPETIPHLPGAFVDERILDEPRLRLWLGGENAHPVAAAALFVEHGVGHFAFAVTRPEARRGGWWTAMVKERLLAEPDLPMVGVFSDDSRPGAERFGFMPIWRFTLWGRPRPGKL